MVKIGATNFTVWGWVKNRLKPGLAARSTQIRNMTPANLTPQMPPVVNKPVPVIISLSGEKVSYDERTAAIMTKVSQPNYQHSLTGLIELETGRLHLMEEVSHERVAFRNGLQVDEISLKPGWVGFNVLFRAGNRLQISPKSGRFGPIHVEQAPLFEAYMADLFSEKAVGQKDILFYQYNYKRAVEAGVITCNLRKHDDLVPRSLSDAELTAFWLRSR